MVECPICHDENAYHNGVCYVCDNCGHEWSDDDDEDEDY